MKDGGPAFPVQPMPGAIIPKELGELVKQFRGMSLRDWFAGEAMKGFISNSTISRGWNMDAFARAAEATAEAAYKQANAMLAVRDKA